MRSVCYSILTCLVLAGCGDTQPVVKSLRVRYEHIRGGMSREDVRSLLGSGRPLTPTDDRELHVPNAPAGSSTVWQDGQTSITVVFIDDRVVAKSRAVAPAKRE